jgi:hypothetical protein
MSPRINARELHVANSGLDKKIAFCNLRAMRTVSQIIDDLGGGRHLASAIGVPVGTVAAWKHRSSIPADHWLAITALPVIEGSQPVTADCLVMAHAKPITPSPASPASTQEAQP